MNSSFAIIGYYKKTSNNIQEWDSWKSENWPNHKITIGWLGFMAHQPL